MDTLSKVLDMLHFNGSFYFATNFQSPWSVEVPNYKNVARFHYVRQGTCWVRVKGQDEPMLLRSGDLILIPKGASHILSDTADRPPLSLNDVFERENYSGSGIFQIGGEPGPSDTRLVCGHFEFSEQYSHPLVSHLPNYIIQREDDGLDLSWVRDTLRFLSHTAINQFEGSGSIIKRLSEVMFIQTLRLWVEQTGVQKGFMAALNDPYIARGLKAFHDDYTDEWSVEKLAHASNMSRSIFSKKFKEYLDVSPMQYVTNWRMQNACELMLSSNMSLERVAHQVGYESAAAFNKAFKRLFNNSPGKYRQLQSQQFV